MVDEKSAGFWASAHNHQLAFQRCQHCGTYEHPPVEFCEQCANIADPQFAFEPVSGRGRIVNWTVMYDAMVAGFEDEAPWVHALIELEEQQGLRCVSTVEGGVTAQLQLGAPVTVTFHDVTETVTLPFFVLTEQQRPDSAPGA
jgi:hypothetical protein